MGILFDPGSILQRSDVPTLYCHGTRRVDVVEGNLVRVWLCEDQPVSVPGLAPMSKPVAIVLVPLACYVWDILAHTEWAFDKGILRTKPRGPAELRPSRVLMQ